MAQKAKAEKAPVLSASDRSVIVKSYGDALASHERGGNLISQVCKSVQAVMRGKDVTKADQDLIAEDIADKRQWSAASREPRMSQVRTILRSYTMLPEAIKAFTEKNNGCATWHDGMMLASKLASGNSQAAAIAFVRGKRSAAGAGTVKSPQAYVAKALKDWYRVVKGEKRADIVKAAKLLNLTIEWDKIGKKRK
jgi:hypothetical protein